MISISKEDYIHIVTHSCGKCLYFKHEENRGSSYCSHKKATDEEKSYRYYNFKCEEEFKFEPINVN